MYVPVAGGPRTLGTGFSVSSTNSPLDIWDEDSRGWVETHVGDTPVRKREARPGLVTPAGAPPACRDLRSPGPASARTHALCRGGDPRWLAATTHTKGRRRVSRRGGRRPMPGGEPPTGTPERRLSRRHRGRCRHGLRCPFAPCWRFAVPPQLLQDSSWTFRVGRRASGLSRECPEPVQPGFITLCGAFSLARPGGTGHPGSPALVSAEDALVLQAKVLAGLDAQPFGENSVRRLVGVKRLGASAVLVQGHQQLRP